jgi:hypothetical protein
MTRRRIWATVVAGLLMATISSVAWHDVALADCNCWVQGKINLDESCTRTTLELYTWSEILEDWVQQDKKEFEDGDVFVLDCFQADGCVSTGRLKSNDGWIHEPFSMPGCEFKLVLGNVYDYKTCVSPDP